MVETINSEPLDSKPCVDTISSAKVTPISNKQEQEPMTTKKIRHVIKDEDTRDKINTYLVGLRTKKGLTQVDLCKKLGLDPDRAKTLVSQCETGYIKVPPERFKDWAKACGEPRDMFAKTMLKFYDPYIYECLFK